jgi:hypothetical protein
MLRPCWGTIGFSSLLLLACGDDPSPAIQDFEDDDAGAEGTASDSSTSTGATDPQTTDPSTAGSEDSSTTEEEPQPPKECGNDILEGNEECEGEDLQGEDCRSQGFEAGTLRCSDECFYDHGDCYYAACGNEVIEDGEMCDSVDLAGESCQTQGFDSGTLACGPYCLSFDTAGCGICGNGDIDGDEVCDSLEVGSESCTSQGFDSGTLSCASDCSGLDTSVCGTCGDGILDAEETCDTGELGGQSCASLGLTGGTLACSTSCGYDVAACDVPGFMFGEDTGYIGYYFDPPSLPCDDISDTGTALGLSDDDNAEVAIGFTFPFYDAPFDMANVQSNGVLRFGDADYHGFSNECLPTTYTPSAYNIYAFWDDLNPDGLTDEVYYETLGSAGDQRFIVQWDINLYSNVGDFPLRFQVMLSEASGQITICYVDTEAGGAAGENGGEATVGIQEGSANGFDYSCNTPDLTSGRQIFYIPI